MKASVVLPVYNKAPFLKACLDSVFAQSFTDYELIAVDDASTDDSLAILRSTMDHRLRIITLDRNVGPGGAAQRGMDVAKGEYILRVDADDVMLPGRFQRQVELMDRGSSIGASSGHVQLIRDPSIQYKVPLEDADCKARLLFGVALNQQVTIYRRSVLQQYGIRFGADWPRYGEDWMQHLLLARVTRFKNIDVPLAIYRTGENNIAHGRDRAADLRSLYRHVFAHFGLPLTDDELELQLATVNCFPRPFDAHRVVQFRKWLDRIIHLNKEHETFNGDALQRQVDGIWDGLLYRMPHFGLKTSLAYLRSGGHLDAQRAYYLAAALLRGGRQTSSRS